MASRPPRLRPQCLAIVAVVAFGAALRLRELGDVSLWLDEALTWLRATLPPDALFADSLARNHTPTYFWLMHHWLRLGDDELMMRLPSVFLGTLKIAAACLLGQVAGGFRVAVLTGLVVSVMPQQLRYDQEARMYALLGFAITVALCGLVWLLRHPVERALPVLSVRGGGSGRAPAAARGAWLALVLGTTLALYSHNTAVFFVAITGVVALVSLVAERHGRAGFARNGLLAQALVLLLWAPWARFFLQQAKHVKKSFWARFPTSDKIESTLADLYLFGADEPAMVLLVVGMLALGTWALRRQRALLVALWLQVLLAPALVLLVSLERPMFLLRVMLWSTVPFAVVMAFAGQALRGRLGFVTLCGLLVAAGGINLEHHYYDAGRKPDWRAALGDIVRKRKPESLVLLAGGREIRQVRYYLERKTRPIPAFDYEDMVVPDPTPALERAKQTRDVWVIHRKTRARTNRVLRFLRKNGRERSVERYGHSLTVRRFRMRARST